MDSPSDPSQNSMKNHVCLFPKAGMAALGQGFLELPITSLPWEFVVCVGLLSQFPESHGL